MFGTMHLYSMQSHLSQLPLLKLHICGNVSIKEYILLEVVDKFYRLCLRVEFIYYNP